MRQNNLQRSAACAALLALTFLTAGCSTSSINWFGSPSSSEKTTTDGAPNAGVADDDIECPAITVRAGASTLTIAGKSTASASGDPSALDLRYQGSIVRTARECRVAAGTMTMKVGIEGRVIVGPVGGPGQLDIPLRLAVVQEGAQPKTVMSKLVRIPVTIGEGVPFVGFTHIDPEIVFPLPQPLGNINSYIVYVGFDPNAGPARPAPAAKPRRKR